MKKKLIALKVYFYGMNFFCDERFYLFFDIFCEKLWRCVDTRLKTEDGFNLGSWVGEIREQNIKRKKNEKEIRYTIYSSKSIFLLHENFLR